jgi:SAM-dependent methyltransferase
MTLAHKLPAWLRLRLRSLRDALRRRLARWRVRPPVGWARLGSLNRVTPISRAFGFDRGTPIDRYYIERFLSEHAADIRGRVLEVGDDGYMRRIGGERVTQREVLHVSPGNPQATLVGSLETGEGLAGREYDCFILTQTLHCIYDMRAAVRTLHRVLAPGGVALVTLPGLSQISRYDADRWGDYWRLTPLAARRLFEESFDPDQIDMRVYGNVLTATAFLYGLALEDLPGRALEHNDADYPLIICLRARRADNRDVGRILARSRAKKRPQARSGIMRDRGA